MVTPIKLLNRRLPEAGRIRTGAKTATGAPTTLPTFRFTSSDQQAIAEIARLYGGTPGEWDAKGGDRFEVITEASEIRIAIPPDPLGGTPIYEAWKGGGCERRCDGVTCVIHQQGPDGPEPVEVPCLCEQEDEMLCKPKTRLSVILPDIRFGGTWRFESGSWNVAEEMPGFVEMIEDLQARGITVARLRMEERVKKTPGKRTRRFKIPVLALDATADQLAAGAGRLGSLGPAAVGEIGPAEDDASVRVTIPDDITDEPGISDSTWARLSARCKEIGEERCREVAAEMGLLLRRGMTEEQAVRFLLATNDEPVLAQIIEGEDY